MPNLNRRHLLQAATAAGLAPALPAQALSSVSGAAATAAAPTGAPTAKLLWASLHRQAGSRAALRHLAQSFGVPAKSAAAIAAKTASAQAITVGSSRPSALERRFRKWLFEDRDDQSHNADAAPE